jgi:hypothetical protein
MKMTILSAVLLAGALGLAAPLSAQDKTPPQPVDEAKLKAERDAAKASQANMTPEQKSAAKKARRAKKQKDLSSIEKAGQPNAPAKREADAKSAAATKDDPKALPDAKARQDALKAQEKQAKP